MSLRTTTLTWSTSSKQICFPFASGQIFFKKRVKVKKLSCTADCTSSSKSGSTLDDLHLRQSSSPDDLLEFSKCFTVSSFDEDSIFCDERSENTYVLSLKEDAHSPKLRKNWDEIITIHGRQGAVNFTRAKWPLTRDTSLRTLIIDNYDSYTFNLYQQLAVTNGAPPLVLRNDELSWPELKALIFEQRAFHNIVISPGPGSPANPEDVGVCAELIRECGDIPILGVCMGHQILGWVHGAQVVHAPVPVHGRLSEVEHGSHPLYRGVPSGTGSGFEVVRYHSLVVDWASLPQDLVATAWTAGTGSTTLPWASNGSASPMNAVDEVEGSGIVGASGVSEDLQASGPLLSFASRQQTTSRTDAHGSSFQERPGTSPLPGRGEPVRSQSGARQREPRRSEFGRNAYENSAPQSKGPWQRTNHDRDTADGALKDGALLMGISHRTRPHHGVQFHPESIGTCYGETILRNFHELTLDYWGASSSQPEGSGGEASAVGPFEERQRNLTRPNGHMSHRTGPTPLQERAGGEAVEGPAGSSVSWEKLEGIGNRVGGSQGLFCSLFGQSDACDTFWLDSSSTDQGRGRFSFMGARGGAMWRKVTYKLPPPSRASSHKSAGGLLRIEDASGEVQEEEGRRGVFEFLDQELARWQCHSSDSAALPFDFCGGFVGYLGYELKVECGADSNRHVSSLPDAAFFLADQLVAVDHAQGDVYVLAVLPLEAPTAFCEQNGKGASANDGRQSALDWVASTVQRIKALAKPQSNSGNGEEAQTSSLLWSAARLPLEGSGFVPVADESTYSNNVDRCLSFIRDGESYELCLTTQLVRDSPPANGLQLYLDLRKLNPAPYAAWFRFGKTSCSDQFYICCSSPERFLRGDRHGVLEAKPIKGTMPRGATPAEDCDLRHRLQNNEKDRAENLMIVDLLRNDLGRVCTVGSVHVPCLMAVESFATVHQLVSTVRGTKKPDQSSVACVRAAFPGGSMTGAPKIRSMDILDSIETCARGVYSGALGYFSLNGTFDLNIVIRTLVVKGNETKIGAGGAVVALSHRTKEYEEMLLKAHALVHAASISSENGAIRRADSGHR